MEQKAGRTKNLRQAAGGVGCGTSCRVRHAFILQHGTGDRFCDTGLGTVSSSSSRWVEYEALPHRLLRTLPTKARRPPHGGIVEWLLCL